VQKSEKPCLGTGSRAKNWNPIGKPAPEIGVNRQDAGSEASNGAWRRIDRMRRASEQRLAAKQTISSGAHASQGRAACLERWGPFGHARQSRAACLERKEQVATECC
jgi:hypothetical protein